MRHHLILRVITKLLVGTIFLFALYVQFHGDADSTRQCNLTDVSLV